MTTYEFPAQGFPALGFDPAPGDPAAVSSGAEASSRFAQQLATDVSTLRQMTVSDWVGEAGDLFRDKVKDLPRDLDGSRAAYEAASRALTDYADALWAARRQARSLEEEAAAALRRMQAAQAEVSSVGRQVPASEAERTRLTAAYQAATGQASQYGDQLGAIRARARQLQADVTAHGDSAAGKIRGASEAPYHEPHWWEKAWDSFMGWVRDNADVLKTISGVLKVVSAVCALLSFIPIVGVFFGAVALAAGAASILIDVAVKLATGQGSWAGIALDAVLTFIPGGKLTKMLGTPFKAGGRLFARMAPELADGIARGARGFSGAVQQGVFQLSRLAPKTRAFERMAGDINSLPAAVGRWTVGHRPQAVVTNAERTFDVLIRGGRTPEAAWSALSAGEKSAIRGVQRTRFWTNVRNGLDNDPGFAQQYGHLFSDGDLALLNGGRAPQHFDPVTRTTLPYQLSHEPMPISAGGGNQIPRAAWQHAAYDPDGFQYANNTYLNDWLRTGRLSPLPGNPIGQLTGDSGSADRTPAGVR